MLFLCMLQADVDVLKSIKIQNMSPVLTQTQNRKTRFGNDLAVKTSYRQSSQSSVLHISANGVISMRSSYQLTLISLASLWHKFLFLFFTQSIHSDLRRHRLLPAQQRFLSLFRTKARSSLWKREDETPEAAFCDRMRSRCIMSCVYL